MRFLLRSMFQLLLVATLFLSFFALTPWLGCQPLDNLPSGERERLTIPANAVCFTNNHNHIAFHEHGLIAAEPYRFAAHMLGFLVSGGLLVWSVRKTKSGGASWKRNESDTNITR